MYEWRSTTGALEAAYKQAHGVDVSLSEQQLVDCAFDFNNNGCNGGLPSQVREHVRNTEGIGKTDFLGKLTELCWTASSPCRPLSMSNIMVA